MVKSIIRKIFRTVHMNFEDFYKDSAEVEVLKIKILKKI